MRITEIVWTEAAIEHIERHAVDHDEVEEVIASGPMWRRGRKHHETGRRSIYALGRTEAGRYLFVVPSPLGSGRARCVTERDMGTASRRIYDRRGR